MISESAVVSGDVSIGEGTLLYPLVAVSDSTIGEGCVLETRSSLKDSVVDHAVIICVGATLSSTTVGAFSKIGPGSCLRNSTVGKLCQVGPGVHLENVTLADNTIVAMSSGSWSSTVLPATQLKPLYEENEAYRFAVGSSGSLQFLGKHTSLRPR